MWLRAGLLTVGMLSLSRLAGVVREMSIAATFGVTESADLAVALIGLPDLMASAIAAGVLTYVLVPLWAHASPEVARQTTGRVVAVLGGLALLAAASMFLMPQLWLRLLVPTASPFGMAQATMAMQINGLALLLAFGAALGNARLLGASDWVGMHGANLCVTGALIAALWWLPPGATALPWLGVAVVLANGLRVTWVQWRLSTVRKPTEVVVGQAPNRESAQAPGALVWVYAAGAVALPYLMPIMARSLDANGPGLVATFSYSWKLVELPLTLVLQWVGLMALPAMIAAANDEPQHLRLLRQTSALATALACAAACALCVGAPAFVALLFGWGRMGGSGDATAQSAMAVARGVQWGAFTLVAQSIFSVLLAKAAAQGQLGRVAKSALLGCAITCGLAAWSATWGADFRPHLPVGMLPLLGGYWVALAHLCATLTPPERRAMAIGRVLMAVVLTALWSVLCSAALSATDAPLWLTGLAGLVACVVPLAGCWLAFPALQSILRLNPR